MKIKLLLLAALGLVQGMSLAQRKCGTMEHLSHQMEQDPGLSERMANIEAQTAQILKQQSKDKGTQAVTYTIPVVVHILYRTTSENISDTQVQSQIAVLNEDFQLLNADNVNVPSLFAGLKANVQINFCLAQRDPNGAATTGITRTVTTKTSFGTNDAVKKASSGGKDPWNTSNYLNLWVCNIGGGILGYAQFPGGAAATDGVVIDYRYFGRNGTAVAPFNKGRTATHEVGHWLNLRHIWGDDSGACTGSDLVGDTPNQGAENYGCPTFPKSSCSNTSDMFMNYMDYTDDACMYMFSIGQSDRMRALFASGGARATLLNSAGCNPPSSCNAPTGLASSNVTTSSATVSWGAVSGAVSYNLQYKTTSATTFTTINTTASSYNLSGLSSGTSYVFQVQTVCASGSSVYSSQASFLTTSTSTCSTPSGLASGSVTASGATLSWAAVSGAASYNLQYKTSSASTFTTVNTTNTSLTLSGLSASTAYVAHVQAVCSSGSSSYSSQISFTTASGSLTYCASKGNSVVDEWIDYVKLNNMTRTSGADGGYVYFTTTPANVTAGTSYTLTISAGFRSGYSATEYWRIWVDWNQNGVFTDAGELMASGSSASSGNLTATLAVPATAKNGNTRMRVSMKWNSAQTSSCETFSYGEVEDYNVVVSGGVNREAESEISQVIQADMNDLAVYPNPVHNILKLDISQLDSFQDGRLMIVDMQGKVVVSEVLKSAQQNLVKSEIETGNLANGLYNLIISTEKGRLTKKIIILHP